MAFTLFQAGATLRTINTDGGLSVSALTLPTGVTLRTNLTPRFARFKRYVVVVNTPTRPLLVGPDGTVYPLTPNPPGSPVALSSGAAGALTGTYLSKIAYEIKDVFGNVITSSDYSPTMAAAVAISAKKLHADFAVSSEIQVNNIKVTRTATLGSTYFPWVNTGNNTTTSVENDNSDASLGTIAVPTLGTAPDLTLIAEFGGRLWGVARDSIDNLRWTEAGTAYGWSALNTLPIPHVGSDGAGITALIPRRAALGVARRTVFSQVTGSQLTNIAPTIVNGGENAGCVSQESVQVYKDVAYFLGQDGVYQWDSNGITCITDGRCRTWFTDDDTFNRSMFWRAFSVFDPIGKKYRLYLAVKGSDTDFRWIEYDIMNGTWWGPSLTTAFAPSSAFLVAGRNQQFYPMVGSREGYISQDQEERNDWGLFPIDLLATVRGEEMDEPEQEKYFGEMSIHLEPQETPGTLVITPSLSSIDEADDPVATAPLQADVQVARQRLGRIGTGNSMILDFENSDINVDTVIHGYEIDPVNVIGRR